MKVRITFEAGDCVEPEMISRTFENSVKLTGQEGSDDDCQFCAFNEYPLACISSSNCVNGAFVEVTETQTKEEAK